MKQTILLGYALIALSLGSVCSQPPPGRGAGETEAAPSSQTNFRVETVVPNLEVPWSIAWAPDGRMFFTERPGRVRIYEQGQLRAQPLFVVPDVEPSGESGLMSLALHPQFGSNHFLYLAYAYKGTEQQVRVVRYKEKLQDDRSESSSKHSGGQFMGCRLRFVRSKAYITTAPQLTRPRARMDSPR